MYVPIGQFDAGIWLRLDDDDDYDGVYTLQQGLHFDRYSFDLHNIQTSGRIKFIF